MASLTLVAKRAFSAWGINYEVGTPVDPATWHKDHRTEALANRLRSGDVGVPDASEVVDALAAMTTPEDVGKKK